MFISREGELKDSNDSYEPAADLEAAHLPRVLLSSVYDRHLSYRCGDAPQLQEVLSLVLNDSDLTSHKMFLTSNE